MAAPVIQYLKHGKALCGKAFAAFVETFNWHNDFCKNLKGDADLPGDGGGNGAISVDRGDPTHPIIRFKGGEVKGETAEGYPSPFQIVNGTIKNCIFFWENEIKQFGDTALPSSGYVFIRLWKTLHEAWQFSLVKLQAIPSRSDEDDDVVAVFYIPVYRLSDEGDVIMDYRSALISLYPPQEKHDFPWEFDPVTGFWKNAYVIVGNRTVRPDDRNALDGDNYLKVNVRDFSAEITDEEFDNTDELKCIYVGTVDLENLVQTSGIYTTPTVVCYE